jgi:hypothetical protein
MFGVLPFRYIARPTEKYMRLICDVFYIFGSFLSSQKKRSIVIPDKKIQLSPKKRYKKDQNPNKGNRRDKKIEIHFVFDKKEI